MVPNNTTVLSLRCLLHHPCPSCLPPAHLLNFANTFTYPEMTPILSEPQMRRAEIVTKRDSNYQEKEESSGLGSGSRDLGPFPATPGLGQPHSPALGSHLEENSHSHHPTPHPTAHSRKGSVLKQEWDTAIPTPALWDFMPVKTTFSWPQFSHL